MTKGLVRANNFSDLADKDEAVVNLGLSATDYAALKGLYTTAGIDFAVIGEIGNSQGNYQAQLDGIGTMLSGVILSGYVNRSGGTILGTWTHNGIIDISGGLPSGYPASTDSLFSLSIESGEAVIVTSGLIASGLSYNGVRQSSSTVQRAFPPSGFSPLHLIPLQVGGQSFFVQASETPSFHIAPARMGHALDLVTGNLLGSYNSASPAWAVGPDGVLALPAANAPVIEYDPVTLACLGARIWGAVTNRLLNSTASVGVSISSGTTNGPNNQAMRKAVPAAGSQSFPAIGQGIETPFSLSSGQTIDVAIGGWLAAGSSGMAIEPRFIVDFYTSPNSNKIYAELQINTSNWTVRSKSFSAGVTEVSAPVITQYSPILFPGVYRVDWVVRYTQGATTRDRTSSYVQLRDSAGSGTFTADGIGHFQFFGLQSTLSSTPQPYVPTTTTTASSTADVWSITGADFSRVWNQSAVTLYAEAVRDVLPGGEFPVLIDARNVNGFEVVQCSYLLETFAGSLARSNNVTQSELYPTGLSGIRTRRVAAAFAQDNFATCANGGIVLTDSSGIMPSPDRINLGSVSSGQFLNGYIRELAIFRSRRPNANLQALTS